MDYAHEEGLSLHPVLLKHVKQLGDRSSSHSYDDLMKRHRRQRNMHVPPDVVKEGFSEILSEVVEEYIGKELALLDDYGDYLTNLAAAIRKEITDGGMTWIITWGAAAFHELENRQTSVRHWRKRAELLKRIVEHDLLSSMEDVGMKTLEFLECKLEDHTFALAFDELLQVFLQWKSPVHSEMCWGVHGHLLPCECRSCRDAGKRASRYKTRKQELDWTAQTYYNALDLSGVASKIPKAHELRRRWCPITKCYHFYHKTRGPFRQTTQIVPFHLGRRFVAYTFGVPAGDEMVIWNKTNALPMCSTIEQLFDKHRVTIVPQSDGEFKFIVLDKIVGQYTIDSPGPMKYNKVGACHNTTLEWKSEGRPSRDFLLWHFLMSLMRTREQDILAWEADKTGIIFKIDDRKIEYRDLWNSLLAYPRL